MPMKSFTHLEAGDHGPVLPLLIVSDYNVDGATKGSKDQENPVKGKFYFLISIYVDYNTPNKLFNCI